MIYHVLYNPIAGHGSSEEKAKTLSKTYGENIFYHDITKISDYDAFISKLEKDDVIILCGGDGTLNRFINATDALEIQNDVLYYAIGTGNDFLKDLGKNVGEEPFSVKSYIKNLPTVEINGQQFRFLNNVGFGIDGYCCEVGDEIKKTSDKPVNYTSIAIKGLLFHYKTTGATVTVDGKSYEYDHVWLAPTMKGRFYGGGMMPTPEQDRNDPSGSLSLLIFKGKSKLGTLIAFPSIFKGAHVKKKKKVFIHQGKDISVTFDRPSTVQIDGETILGVTSYRATANVSIKAAK